MSDAWAEVSSEFLHLYPRGRRLLVVAGADAERSRLAADDLSVALAAAEQQTERSHCVDGDERSLRSDVIAPFRASPATSDTVLIVSGSAALLDEAMRGLWNFIAWQLVGDEAPHSIASAIIDVTDPANPVRRFADYCALPASYGA